VPGFVGKPSLIPVTEELPVIQGLSRELMIGGEQADFYGQMARQPIKTELLCRSTLADCDPR